MIYKVFSIGSEQEV